MGWMGQEAVATVVIDKLNLLATLQLYSPMAKWRVASEIPGYPVIRYTLQVIGKV